MAERGHELLAIDSTIWEEDRTHPAVTDEKASSMILSWVILGSISAKAILLRGWICSLIDWCFSFAKNSLSEVATPDLPRRIYSLGSRAGEPSLPSSRGCNRHECRRLEI